MQSEMTTLLLSTFGRLVGEQHPIAQARKALPCDAPAQQALWSELADGGWLDAGCRDFQQENGAHTLLLGEITGRSLMTLPYASTAFLLMPLLEADASLLADGLVSPLRDFPASVRCSSVQQDDGWIEHFGEAAQYLHLLPVEDGAWRLERHAPSTVAVLPGMDPTIGLGRLGQVAVTAGTLTSQVVLPVLQRHFAFELAHLVGAAGASLDMAIAYAKEREQFGRPIGQFQAVKHALVDAWMGLDNARYALRSLLSATADGTLAPDLAGTAHRLAVSAGRRACKLAIQVHGGIGFAWEHDAHLYLKRVYHLAITTQRSLGLLQAAA